MPNHCMNGLLLKSKNKDTLLKFLDKYSMERHKDEAGHEDDGEGLNFDKIITEPKTIDECPLLYRSTPEEGHYMASDGRPWFNWYEWHLNFWGTKWNAYDQSTSEIWEDDGYYCLSYSFDTAWSPCMPIINELINTYEPEEIIFHYSYYEPGNWFAGRIYYEEDTNSYVSEKAENDEDVKRIAIEEEFEEDFSWMEDDESESEGEE